MIPGNRAGHKKEYIMNQIIAHRGASAYAPENTLASFNKALSLGSRFIEFDVMLSADGSPFIFHDEPLKRTTNGRGEFGLTNSVTIQSLDAGSWFSKRFKDEKVPSLLSVIEWLLISDVQANIEIKPYPGTTEQTTVEVLTHLNRYWPHDKKLPIVSSFDREALTLCRSLSPEMPLGYLMHFWEEDWLKSVEKLNPYSVHLSCGAATQARVQSIKAEGYLVFVYTVNSQRQARTLFSWGVDAVFSDYPDLLGMENA